MEIFLLLLTRLCLPTHPASFKIFQQSGQVSRASPPANVLVMTAWTLLSCQYKETIYLVPRVVLHLPSKIPFLPNIGVNVGFLVLDLFVWLSHLQSSAKAAWGKYGIIITPSHSTSELYYPSWLFLSSCGKPSSPIFKSFVLKVFPNTWYIAFRMFHCIK